MPITPTTIPAMPSPRAVPSVPLDVALVWPPLESAAGAAAGVPLAGAAAPSVAAAVSFSVGAGCAGSGRPACARSIHRTTVPSLYVWSALNGSESTLSGSGPKETGNCWNCPASIFPPVQVISLTAESTVPSSVFSGVASLVVVTFAVHPGTGWIDTDAIGWSVGRKTSSLTVDALSSSSGTLKATVL
jgi:hypothetical protein